MEDIFKTERLPNMIYKAQFENKLRKRLKMLSFFTGLK